MKKNILITMSLTIAFLTSCNSYQYSYRTTDIQRSIKSTPVVCEMKVDLTKKIECSSDKQISPNLAISNAYYKAITENNVDVIVDAVYKVKTQSKILFFGGKSTATIVGYGAKYINSKPITSTLQELNKIDTTDVKKFNMIYNQ